jgi:hypothetical protein
LKLAIISLVSLLIYKLNRDLINGLLTLKNIISQPLMKSGLAVLMAKTTLSKHRLTKINESGKDEDRDFEDET